MSVRKAARLYEGFREETPRRARRVAVDLPRAVAVMGHVEFIGYSTTHGGRSVPYLHVFAAGSRPLFTAGVKRNQIVLVGGRYRVTPRGIVDLDAAGRAVPEGLPRYKVVQIRRPPHRKPRRHLVRVR